MASTRPDERGAEAPVVKASTFDLTPTGPLGAGSLLSPLSTTPPPAGGGGASGGLGLVELGKNLAAQACV